MSQQTAPAEDGSKGAQVQVSFVTELDDFRVSDAPILLPTRLRRAGLSEVVNHLLGGTTPHPFDFLLSGQLLRGTLADGLLRHGLTGEAAVTLQYILCVPPPKSGPVLPHKDWVAALAAHPRGSGLLLSGCYDHAAYVWHTADRQIALSGHTGAVKAVAWLAGGSDADGLRAATGSKDHTIRLWSVAASGTSATAEAVLTGHVSSVEAIVANPAGDRICSGAWDGTMLLWDAGAPPQTAEDSPPPPKKKRGRGGADSNEAASAASARAPVERSPADTLSGHSSSVDSLCWPTAALLYSGSWDGTVREWQLDVGSPSATLTGQAAVLCVDVSLSSGLIASGHTDHAMRLWDSRLQSVAPVLSLPHSGWVSAAKWCAQQPHLLASACYDGSVRLWDVRSTLPLHVVSQHDGKALCLTWDGDERLASGGTDAALRLASIAQPA